MQEYWALGLQSLSPEVKDASFWRMYAVSLGVVLRNCCRFGAGSWNKVSLGKPAGHPEPAVSGKHPRFLLRVMGMFYFSEFRNATMLSLSGLRMFLLTGVK